MLFEHGFLLLFFRASIGEHFRLSFVDGRFLVQEKTCSREFFRKLVKMAYFRKVHFFSSYKLGHAMVTRVFLKIITQSSKLYVNFEPKKFPLNPPMVFSLKNYSMCVFFLTKSVIVEFRHENECIGVLGAENRLR